MYLYWKLLSSIVALPKIWKNLEVFPKVFCEGRPNTNTMVYSKVFLLALLMYNQQYQKALRYLNFHHPWRRRCWQKLKMKLWNVSFFNKQENKPNLLVNPHDNKNVETGETASQGSFTMSHEKELVRLFWIENFFLTKQF